MMAPPLVFYGRVQFVSDQQAAKVDYLLLIHLQSSYRRTAHRCQTNDVCEIVAPSKMAPPPLAARIEQSDGFVRPRINADYFFELVAVAGRTREREVAQDGLAVLCSWEDMFDFK